MKFSEEYNKHCETKLVMLVDDIIDNAINVKLTNLRRVGYSRVAFEASDGSTVTMTHNQLRHMLGIK